MISNVNDNSGYFATLGLNYDCSEYEIKRVYQELYEKYCLALQNNKSNNADNINKPENKEDNIKNLLRKICTAYQVLSEKQSREHYLTMIKARCYLSQASQLDDIFEKNYGQIFPFFVFEIIKKNILKENKISLLYFNFVEMIIEEKREDELVKAVNMTSITQAYPGFDPHEFYIKLSEHDECKTTQYFAAYEKQRDLIVELLLFSKFICDKKKGRLEKIKNPIFDNKTSTESLQTKSGMYRIPNTKLKTPSSNDTNYLLLLENDRILPPKSIFKCEVNRKGVTLISGDKPAYIFIGSTQIIVSWDPQLTRIIKIFPIDHNYLQLQKSKEPTEFVLNTLNSNYVFQTKKESDQQAILLIIDKILKNKLNSSHIIHSVPFKKTDISTKRALTRHLEEVNKKIEEVKSLLARLINEKEEIELLLLNEEADLQPRKSSDLSVQSQASSKISRGRKKSPNKKKINSNSNSASSRSASPLRFDTNRSDEKPKKINFGTPEKSNQTVKEIESRDQNPIFLLSEPNNEEEGTSPDFKYCGEPIQRKRRSTADFNSEFLKTETEVDEYSVNTDLQFTNHSDHRSYYGQSKEDLLSGIKRDSIRIKNYVANSNILI